jgi:hypothetical protein
MESRGTMNKSGRHLYACMTSESPAMQIDSEVILQKGNRE